MDSRQDTKRFPPQCELCPFPALNACALPGCSGSPGWCLPLPARCPETNPGFNFSGAWRGHIASPWLQQGHFLWHGPTFSTHRWDGYGNTLSRCFDYCWRERLPRPSPLDKKNIVLLLRVVRTVQENYLFWRSERFWFWNLDEFGWIWWKWRWSLSLKVPKVEGICDLRC